MTDLLTIPSEQYHQDDLGYDEPSLSASIAHTLVSQSPAHARAAHPKLNPDYERKMETKFILGTAAHALFLEGKEAVEVVAAADWRGGDARAMRDEALAAGKLPMLAHDWQKAQEMCEAVREQLERFDCDPPMFTEGKPEQTLVWRDQGVLCRARVDWLRFDLRTIDDLKSTSRVADPAAWSKRALYDHGADIQAAMYIRAVKTLFDTEPVWRWAIVETTAPYAVSVVTPGSDVLAVADSKVDYALRRWKQCLSSGEWPAYGTTVYRAELPPWVDDGKWLEEAA